MNFWIKIKNIGFVWKSLIVVWFIKDTAKLERRLTFLEDMCHDDVKASREYLAITWLYNYRIQQINSKNKK